ncbi:MAG: hypothetical protein ACR2L6_09460 [Gemmatimonadaceae bacterium]
MEFEAHRKPCGGKSPSPVISVISGEVFVLLEEQGDVYNEDRFK